MSNRNLASSERRLTGPRLLVPGLLSLTSLLGACGGSGDIGADVEGWNVLLVTLDTTRADRLSCYGHTNRTTPFIDELAAGGARFERAISTAGITPMSHSSILTGLNNYRHGMRVFYSDTVTHRLKTSVDTLPEILRAEGWATAAMVSSYPVSEVYGLDQGFDDFETGLDLENLDITSQQKHEAAWFDGPDIGTQRRGDVTVDDALAWLEETGDAPWCLWVHMFDVHDFSIIPPESFLRSLGIQELDKTASLQNPMWRERMYDPELRFMDAQVGRLLDWVREHDQLERTIIVITADHGQGLLDGAKRHQWLKHRLLYDWCIRVPLVMHVPGEAPIVVGNQVRTIDILPTILEVLGLPEPDIEGESLLGLIRGETEDTPRLAYADALNREDTHSPKGKLPENCRDNLFCVTDGRWKLIYHQEVPAESQLFDLQTDPQELDNVYAAHPEEAQRLKAFLDEKQAMVLEPPTEGGIGPDAATLEALGYGGGDSDEEDDH